jgi:hypothetical protein
MRIALSAANCLVLLAWLVVAELLWIHGTIDTLGFLVSLAAGALLARFSFTRLHRVAKNRWPDSYAEHPDGR